MRSLRKARGAGLSACTFGETIFLAVAPDMPKSWQPETHY
jgi:hypothetical protein